MAQIHRLVSTAPPCRIISRNSAAFDAYAFSISVPRLVQLPCFSPFQEPHNPNVLSSLWRGVPATVKLSPSSQWQNVWICHSIIMHFCPKASASALFFSLSRTSQPQCPKFSMTWAAGHCKTFTHTHYFYLLHKDHIVVTLFLHKFLYKWLGMKKIN